MISMLARETYGKLAREIIVFGEFLKDHVLQPEEIKFLCHCFDRTPLKEMMKERPSTSGSAVAKRAALAMSEKQVLQPSRRRHSLRH